jgi:hypothetical protein
MVSSAGARGYGHLLYDREGLYITRFHITPSLIFRSVIGHILIAVSLVVVAADECPQYEARGLGRSAK